jgi:hypothetical protein
MENRLENALFLDRAPQKALRARLSLQPQRAQCSHGVSQSPLVAESSYDEELSDCPAPPAARLSLGAIARKRESLPLFERARDLETQVSDLQSAIAAMSAAFASTFAAVTLARLSAEFERRRGRPPLPVDPAPIIASLPLADRPCEEWALLIETALSRSLA